MKSASKQKFKSSMAKETRFFLFNNIIFNTILQENTVSKHLREIAFSSVGETSSKMS
jgi:hypothetical protein